MINLFKWSKWMDISTGSLCSYKYVIQARRHENGKIKMRVEQIYATDHVAHPTLEQLEKIK